MSIQVHFDDSRQLRRYIAELSEGQAILSFSAGKDSVAAWLAMQEHFDEIVPVYLYMVPGLEFVEEGLRYYEEFFGTHVIRLPHPSLYRWITTAVFQPPERLAYIESREWPNYDYDDVFNLVKVSRGLPLETFTAIGVRSADSLNRRTSIKRYGSVNVDRRTFFPIFDWRKDKMIAELKQADVMLTIDYQVFGRSYDGIDWRFIGPIKEHFPDDYERILEWFPMAELEIKRIEYREEYYAK